MRIYMDYLILNFCPVVEYMYLVTLLVILYRSV